MIIAVASGKGGTGKTTVSVALALSVSGTVSLLDCDVEEPNAALFISAGDVRESEITVPVPRIDEITCSACGACARFCEFNAIVHIGKTVMVFPELCHSCGGCTLVCPQKAIVEVPSSIGKLAEWTIVRGNASFTFRQGILSIGKAMSPPVIRAVKAGIADVAVKGTNSNTVIIDSPPGTSCPMVTAVADADYVILVTEPTPFGLHDLGLAVKTVRAIGLPFGVIVNRSDSGDDRVIRYCKAENISVLLEIPEDRRVAEAYSRGISLIDAVPEYRAKFAGVLEAIN